MAKDPRKRQKALERKNAKRKEKQHALQREAHKGLAERILTAVKNPVYECLISNTLASQGIGNVVLARPAGPKHVVAVAFLIDSYCLGVKSTLGHYLTYHEYDHEFRERLLTDQKARPIPPAEAKRFILAAVAFAQKYGFSPDEDFAKMFRLFGDIETAPEPEPFQFGKDGKPFFVNGPMDSQARVRQILATLARTAGEGNYHYMMSINPNHYGISNPLPEDTVEFDDDFEDDDEDETEEVK